MHGCLLLTHDIWTFGSIFNIRLIYVLNHEFIFLYMAPIICPFVCQHAFSLHNVTPAFWWLFLNNWHYVICVDPLSQYGVNLKHQEYFADSPTTGMDPASRDEWRAVRDNLMYKSVRCELHSEFKFSLYIKNLF